ncbi:MAG TPA: PIG-L family deacetylase [Terriglobia bacterium]|nr:PIG-L family deacetylase [Terriglobia bacterium]
MNVLVKRFGYLLSCIFLLGSVGFGQLPQAPPSPGPDARYKADILVMVAHPDDESEIASYLAREAVDGHKRIAVVFGTCGNSGGNTVGYEQAASLCAVREIELRRALESLGIMNVWFLNGEDTASQSPLISLETWNHGAALWRAVRYVRLTRPEVMITWLPDYADGENHGDHQASSVIANEAFDLAGNPLVFPEQVTAPYNYKLIGNLTEGLRPWQPKKIYFFTNARHHSWIAGQGPVYPSTTMSPSKHVPYYELGATELSYHQTQENAGPEGREAVYREALDHFKYPVQFILGKSLVGGSTTGDVFEGITPGPIPYHAPAGYQTESHEGVSVELGGPYLFYQQFWKAHGLDHLASLYPHEAGVGPGMEVSVPVIIRNDTDAEQKVSLTVDAPSGWKEESGSAVYPVAAHNAYPIRVILEAPEGTRPEWQEIHFKATAGGEAVSPLTLRVSDVPSGPRATLRK